LDWTVALIEASTVDLLGKQGRFRPAVRRLSVEGRTLVAKDYRACTPLYRWTVGAWNLWTEKRALRRLAGMDGVPALEAEAGRWIFVMSHIEGRDVGKARKLVQTPLFFERLSAMVDEMHRRGVVHLDLRQRRNILVRPKRRPAIVDFGGALCLKPGSWLLRRLAPIDRSGVLKYKQRADPASLTPDEARILRKVERRRSLWPFS
jgi:hypothetical protein